MLTRFARKLVIGVAPAVMVAPAALATLQHGSRSKHVAYYPVPFGFGVRYPKRSDPNAKRLTSRLHPARRPERRPWKASY